MQQRLKAYLGLIQELLTCPVGEEWIRLRHHEGLVDPGLVQTMEQVANTLAQQGDRQRAKFLHNWAGQLHHILAQAKPSPPDNRSQAYLDLIQALLKASPQEQQQLIADHQDLIGPGLVQMMRQIAAQLVAQGNEETAIYLANLAEEMGKLWLYQHSVANDQAATDQVETDQTDTLPEKRPDGHQPDQTQMPESSFKGHPQPRSAAVADGQMPDLWVEDSGSTKEDTPSPLVEALKSNSFPEKPIGSAVSTTPKSESGDLIWPQLGQQLSAIATALTELNQRLAASTPTPSHPLWHLEALEQAHQSGWILTTEELEKLIEVKPKCQGKKNYFERGSWRFVKVGRIGSQMAWRIEKQDLQTP